MSSIYKAVCEMLIRKSTPTEETRASNANDYCCLCFDALVPGSEVTFTTDTVVLDSGYGPCIEEMTTVLLKVLGNDVVTNIGVFKSMCCSCTKSVIESYKFTQKCRERMEQFVTAFDNINDCFNNIADDLSNFQTMFVSIDTTNLAIEQVYDNKRNSKDVALQRFLFLIHGRRIMHEEKKDRFIIETELPQKIGRRPRDFSTIFIKTRELMVDPSSKEFKCNICMKVYDSAGSLRLHFFSAHFKKDYQCSYCPKSFGTSGLLQTHEKESHSTVSCNDCGKLLLNRTSTIKRHQLTHITKNKKCERCGRVYKKRTDFQRHIEQNTCIMPSRMRGDYVCDHCGKHCHFKHQLMAHMRFEHGNAEGHVCKWCGRKCYNQSALKVHILKHTKEKNFVCSHCGRKFVTGQSLVNHTRLHTGERPYPCSLCDQSFLSASRRKEHIERHHTDGTFECDLCDAKYNARRSLVKHRKRHFNSVEFGDCNNAV